MTGGRVSPTQHSIMTMITLNISPSHRLIVSSSHRRIVAASHHLSISISTTPSSIHGPSGQELSKTNQGVQNGTRKRSQDGLGESFTAVLPQDGEVGEKLPFPYHFAFTLCLNRRNSQGRLKKGAVDDQHDICKCHAACAGIRVPSV